MNKTLLKLATVGAAITLLLAMLMIAGCKQNPTSGSTTTQSATGTGNSTFDTQITPSGEEQDPFDIPDTQPGNAVAIPTEDKSDIDVPINDTPSQGDTKPQLNKPDTQDTEPTIGNTQTDGKPTQPTQPSQAETEPKYSVTLKDYEAMTPAQQLAYMQSFPSMEDYVEWLRWAKAEDDEDGEHLELENGVVEINP